MVYHSDFDYNTLNADLADKERVKEQITKLEHAINKRNYAIIALSILSVVAIGTIWVAYRRGGGQNIIPFGMTTAERQAAAAAAAEVRSYGL